MRILTVSHYGLPHVGGIEVAIDALARELTRRGHEVVHVAAASVRRDDPVAPDASPPYRCVRIPALNALELRLGVPWPVFSPRLLEVLRREAAGADVVHAHGFLYLGTVAAMSAGGGAARVVTEHVGEIPYDTPALAALQRAAIGSLGRWTLRRADVAVVLNEKVEAEVALLAPRTPIETIPNGVDLARFRPAQRGEREQLRARLGWDARPRLLFVGRLVEKKGLALVVEAARRMPQAQLVLVGPAGSDRPQLPANAEWLGALAPAALADVYRAADVFVLPSVGEGFPVTAQEAMASGLPVVLGEAPWYRPYLAGAERGVRAVPRDADAVTAAVSALLADQEAGSAAAAHAQRRFSWSIAADRHEAAYARAGALSRGRGGRRGARRMQ